ncbi:MAG: hypothetical protein WCF90_04150 [Methanomicrobiales archaeon]
MIDSQMTETVRYVPIIMSEFISVKETLALQFFDSHRDESLTGAILNNIHPAFSSALRDVEHWDLTGSSTTPVSLSSPAKVRLIHFNLPGNSKKSVTIRTDDWLPIQVEEIVDRVIGWTKLMSGFSN